MSWNVVFSGDAAMIRKQFDSVFAQSRANNMNDGELADIAFARDYVADQANRHGMLEGSASGSWDTLSIAGVNGNPATTTSSFGGVQVQFKRSPNRTT